MRLFLFLLATGFILLSCRGPHAGDQVFVRQHHGKGIVDGYWLYTPANYDPTKAYPVILFLSGGQTAATSNHYDAKSQGPAKFLWDEKLSSELKPYLRDSFLIINPHMKVGGMDVRQWYQYSDEVMHAIAHVSQTHTVDQSRIYATGLSRGAHGIWGVAKRNPEVFAALAPLAGQLSCAKNCEGIDWVPKWIFHGDQDATVAINHSWEMVHRMESQGINFHHYKSLNLIDDDHTYPFLFTQFEGRGHDIWDDVYSDVHFYQWLLKQKLNEAK